eukprot:359936-Amorphochlora_amoeboformis.AAC.1
MPNLPAWAASEREGVAGRAPRCQVSDCFEKPSGLTESACFPIPSLSQTNEETTVTVTQLISTKPGPLAKRARRVGQGSRSTIIIQAAMKSSQGRKRKMQDESILSLNFKVPGHSLPGPWSFAGVFDGHGGCGLEVGVRDIYQQLLVQVGDRGRTVSNQLKTSLLKDLKNEMKLQRVH